MNELKKIMSIDAESDGLWGNPFAVAAIVYENGKEIDQIVLRLPNSAVSNEWVKENVLPTLDSVKITHEVYEDMMRDFASFYLKHKDAATLWHMGHIVESHLFREMHRLGFIGDWDAPYTPIEVSAYLEREGEPSDSVDSYAKKHNLEIKDYGTSHNPLYDCEVAYRVYQHILSE